MLLFYTLVSILAVVVAAPVYVSQVRQLHNEVRTINKALEAPTRKQETIIKWNGNIQEGNSDTNTAVLYTTSLPTEDRQLGALDQMTTESPLLPSITKPPKAAPVSSPASREGASLSPTPGLPSESMRQTILRKLTDVAKSSPEIICAAFVIPVTLYLARCLPEEGLLAGAGATVAIFAQIDTDSRTSWIVRLTVGAAYTFFHTAYCARRTSALRFGEGYIAITILLALFVGVVLLYVSVIATAINNCSALLSIGCLLVLHMAIMFITSAAVNAWRSFFTSRYNTNDNGILQEKQNASSGPNCSALADLPP